jgi:hypothetical protein
LRVLPYPPRGVWGNSSVFNGLERGYYCKVLCFRNLEAKLLKMEDLCVLVCETEPGEMRRGLRATNNSQLQVSGFRGIIGKWRWARSH